MYRAPARPADGQQMSQPQAWGARPSYNIPRGAPPQSHNINNRPAPPSGPQPCFNCGQIGHFVKNCPHPSQCGNFKTPASDAGQNSGQRFINKRFLSTKTGRVHFMNVEEIPEGEPVTAGKFSFHGHFTIVWLFECNSLSLYQVRKDLVTVLL